MSMQLQVTGHECHSVVAKAGCVCLLGNADWLDAGDEIRCWWTVNILLGPTMT